MSSRRTRAASAAVVACCLLVAGAFGATVVGATDRVAVSDPAAVTQTDSGTDAAATSRKQLGYGNTMTSEIDSSDPTVFATPRSGDRTGTWYYEPVTFEGEAGDVIHANLTAVGTETLLVLRNPAGETVATVTPANRREPSHLVTELDSNGTYTLRVMGRNPMTTFAYRLSLDQVVGFDSDPDEVDVGESVLGGISDDDPSANEVGGSHDNLTLAVRRGQRITVNLHSPAATQLRVYAPNGTRLWATAADGPGAAIERTLELPYGGEYRVTVSGPRADGPFEYWLAVDGHSRETVDISNIRLDNKEYAEFEVRETTLNTTTRYAGTPFEVTATVENTGTVRGRFDAVLRADQTKLALADDAIDAGRSGRVTVTGTVDQPGPYHVFISETYVGELQVLPRPETSVSISTANATIRTVVSHARTNGTVAVPLESATGADHDFERLALRFDRPVRRLSLNATERAAGTGDAAPDSLPPGIRPLRVLSLDAAMPGDGAVGDTVTLALDGSVSTTAADEPAYSVGLFRAAGGDWTPVDPTSRNVTGAAYRFQAPVDATGTLVLGERVPAVRVTDLAAANGSAVMETPITVSANVSNRGLATGTRTVSLRIADGQVATRTVTLAPGESRTVEFTYAFESPGTYDVTVGDRSASVEVSLDASTGVNGSDGTTSGGDAAAPDSDQSASALGTAAGASDPAPATDAGASAGSANSWLATTPLPVVLIVSLVLVLALVLLAVGTVRFGR